MKMGHPVQICGISLYCSHKGKWIKLMLTDHWWILTDLPCDNNYSPKWFMSFEHSAYELLTLIKIEIALSREIDTNTLRE